MACLAACPVGVPVTAPVPCVSPWALVAAASDIRRQPVPSRVTPVQPFQETAQFGPYGICQGLGDYQRPQRLVSVPAACRPSQPLVAVEPIARVPATVSGWPFPPPPWMSMCPSTTLTATPLEGCDPFMPSLDQGGEWSAQGMPGPAATNEAFTAEGIFFARMRQQELELKRPIWRGLQEELRRRAMWLLNSSAEADPGPLERFTEDPLKQVTAVAESMDALTQSLSERLHRSEPPLLERFDMLQMASSWLHADERYASVGSTALPSTSRPPSPYQRPDDAAIASLGGSKGRSEESGSGRSGTYGSQQSRSHADASGRLPLPPSETIGSGISVPPTLGSNAVWPSGDGAQGSAVGPSVASFVTIQDFGAGAGTSSTAGSASASQLPTSGRQVGPCAASQRQGQSVASFVTESGGVVGGPMPEPASSAVDARGSSGLPRGAAGTPPQSAQRPGAGKSTATNNSGLRYVSPAPAREKPADRSGAAPTAPARSVSSEGGGVSGIFSPCFGVIRASSSRIC